MNKERFVNMRLRFVYTGSSTYECDKCSISCMSNGCIEASCNGGYFEYVSIKLECVSKDTKDAEMNDNEPKILAIKTIELVECRTLDNPCNRCIFHDSNCGWIRCHEGYWRVKERTAEDER